MSIRREKKALGYAVSTVNMKDLELRPEGDLARILTGRRRESIFLTPADSPEVAPIIMFLSAGLLAGPNQFDLSNIWPNPACGNLVNPLVVDIEPTSGIQVFIK